MSVFISTGTKSIPLQALPPEAWQAITGHSVDGDSIIARYNDVPYLYRAVNLRVQALSDLPYSWHVGDTYGQEQAEMPSFTFSLEIEALLRSVEMSLLMFGCAYIVTERNRTGFIKSLRVVHPNSMTANRGKSGDVISWTRQVASDTITLRAEDVIDICVDPVESEIGHGVGEAQIAARAAGVLHNLDEFTARFFSQGAVNPTVISVPSTSLPADQERLQAWYKRMLTGVKRAFSLTIVPGEVKAVQLGYPVNQLATPELTAAKREDICTALGIPQTLMNSNAANYATARKDDLHFYTKTVVPRGTFIADILNDRLFEPQGYALVFHPERLECYQAAEADKAFGLNMLVQARVLTVNEARARMGMPPLETDPALAQSGSVLPSEVRRLVTDNVITPQEARDMLNLAPMDAGGTPRGTPTSTSAGTTSEKGLHEEVRQWVTVLKNRWAEGKPERAWAFKAQAIPPVLMAATLAQLKDATSLDEAVAIVSGLSNWNEYP